MSKEGIARVAQALLVALLFATRSGLLHRAAGDHNASGIGLLNF